MNPLPLNEAGFFYISQKKRPLLIKQRAYNLLNTLLLILYYAIR